MHCSPLDAPFGARLHLGNRENRDNRDQDMLLTEEDRETLRRAFAEHGFLLVREGPLSDARQIELLSAIGRIEPDESGQPMRMEVTNQHDQTTAPDGELVFHSDYAYDPAPIPGISMYGAIIDEGATPTLFASASRVLDRLPQPLLDRLRDLHAAHACFLYRLDAPEMRSSEPDPLIARGQPGWGPDHYWTHHPAILSNAFGVETLFLCLQHTDRFIGLSRAESDDLLAEIYSYLYAPSEILKHVWQTDDLVIWDNLTVQHARPAPLPPRRTLRRYHLSDTDLTADYLRVAREKGLV